MNSFETWWEESGQHWAAKHEAEGGVLWTNDMAEREALFARRYRRPPPPDLPAIVSLVDFNRRANAA